MFCRAHFPCAVLRVALKRALCSRDGHAHLHFFSYPVLSHPEQATLNALFESDPDLIVDIVELLKSDRPVPMFLKTAGFRCLQAFVQAQMR